MVKARKFSKEFELFVSKLPIDYTQEQIQSSFQLFGQVQKVQLLLNKKSGYKGSAFVQFDNQKSLENVMQNKEAIIPGVQLRIEKPQKPVKQHQSILYVNNLAEGTQEKELWNYFSQFGSIKQFKLFQESSQCKIQYFNHRSVKQALLLSQGYDVGKNQRDRKVFRGKITKLQLKMGNNQYNSEQALNISLIDPQFPSLEQQLYQRGFNYYDFIDVYYQNISDLDEAIEYLNSRSQQQFECPVCMLETKELVQFQQCGHEFCQNCVKSYLQIQIIEGRVFELCCLHHNCKAYINQWEVQQLVDAEIWQKYTFYKEKAEQESNQSIILCPYPDCNGVAQKSRFKQKVQCDTCKNPICKRCKDIWHQGMQCKQNEDNLIEQWVNTNNTKTCPFCSRRIQKIEGCDHITCVKCKYEWCWLCGQQFTYNHIYKCKTLEQKRKNPDALKILFFTFIILLIPFLTMIILVKKIYQIRSEGQQYTTSPPVYIQRTKWSYFWAVILGLLLNPIILLFLMLFGPMLILWRLRQESILVLYQYNISKFQKFIASKLGLIFLVLSGFLLIPFTPLILLFALISAQMYGIFLIMQKLIFALRKCCS